jgi:hypothetical protein
MPGKSRQAKGKPAHLSKKSRARQRGDTVAQPPADTAVVGEEVVASAPPAPKAAPAPAKVKAAPYPYIGGELRKIAVLAVIIVAALVVLSLVLS